jgi:uncharacterized protein (UPF0276 family)
MSPEPKKIIPRDALGLGLRPAHYAHVFGQWPAVDYFEVISENFLSSLAIPKRQLATAASRYPLVLHGVGLNLLGHQPLDERYLDALTALAEQIDAPFVSDHLCWTRSGAVNHHDLLPTPHVHELIDYAAERAAYVQTRLGRPFAIENLSSYVRFASSDMTEWGFYSRVVRESGCSYLLDVNNIFVSAHNFGFAAEEYLESIDFDRVIEVHLAGHETRPDGLRIDTHDRPILDEVWSLYALAWAMGGPFPTLIERDDALPPFSELMREMEHAREVRR